MPLGESGSGKSSIVDSMLVYLTITSSDPLYLSKDTVYAVSTSFSLIQTYLRVATYSYPGNREMSSLDSSSSWTSS